MATSEVNSELTANVDGGSPGGLSRRASILIIFLVVSAVVLPIAFMGVPDGFDLMQHIRFAAAYQDAVLSGHLIPKWAGNDNFGFGSIGIRYYPPLAYYVLAVTRIMTGSWYHSFWLTSFGWALLGSTGVYLWVKEWTSNLAGTFAAVFYALIPYHTFQLYQAVLYSEFAASGILPFCFLYLTRVCRRGRWIDAILLAVTYSALVLTHIPTAIIATLCIAAYGLFIVDWQKIRDTAVKVGAAVLLSGLAVAFHLVKALTEVDWVKHNSPQFFGSGYYDYKSYFFPIFFSAPATRYVEKLLWHLDTIIFLTILLFLLPIFAFFRNRAAKTVLDAEPKFRQGLMITGIFSLFMLSIGSSFIWNSVPALQKIQFPWRWLLLSSLMGSAVFAIAAARLLFKDNKLDRVAVYPVLLFVLIVVLFDVSQNIIPSTPLSHDVFENKIENMNDEEGCECWWPIWARNGAFAQKDQAVAGSRMGLIAEWNSESRSVEMGPGDAGNLRIATFYHPYWAATVNGDVVPVGRDADGTVLIPLPAEAANVHLFFREPEFLAVLSIVSFVVWILLALYLAGYFVWIRKTRPSYV